MYVASKMFLTKGIGQHREKLVSFELALRDASLAPYNLVRVSSIFPPHCEIIPIDDGVKELKPGQIVHSVISECSSDENHRLIAASVGVAIPRDRDQFGYLSEHHAYGQDQKVAGDYAEDLAAQMLATILGIKFDADQSYDERLDLWKLSEKIVQTQNITQTGIGQNGLWTTVLAAAVLLQ
ncbi:MAG: arginine decarboxylase, pyruvoyl-dependent [Candidatus Latescibacteria bacterium]|nr:arginine decarboxylase, pyruvoyl-dependent [Candidatus Latescibacterota bacterium]